MAGGFDIEVSICQRVHHQWVVVRRQHTSAADAVEEMHITSRKVFVHRADMGQLLACAPTVGTKNLTVLRLEQQAQ